MIVVAAVAQCALLALLAVFQIALAAGAPLGHFAWGGQHRVLPKALRVGSAVSVLLYAFIAWVTLDRAGMLGGTPSTLSVIAAWVFFAYFVVGTVMNGISRSRPERAVMTPVCVLLAVASLTVALG